MGLKIGLEWYDKKTEYLVAEAYSEDFGDDDAIIDTLGLPPDNTINNGLFDVKAEWVPYLQPFFREEIILDKYDYFVAFHYRDKW